MCDCFWKYLVKGELSGLRRFLATESSLRMMKKIFYFTLKAFLVLKIYKCVLIFWSCMYFGYDKKNKVSFKNYDVTVWLTNNCNTHIDQYLKK